MIEHTPWVGSEYHTEGINGQRIAIMGFSHHHDPSKEKDGDDFTIKTIEEVLAGKLDHPFFKKIVSYFGFKSEQVDFWNRVMFFNYLPNSVEDDWYSRGNPEQRATVKNRFTNIIFGKDAPQKVIILTRKAWEDIPELKEERAGNKLLALSLSLKEFQYGTYEKDGCIVKVFGLKHPQYAKTADMCEAVRLVMQA